MEAPDRYADSLSGGAGADAAAFRPVERISGDVNCGYLLLCDHASNALPAEYGSLGLPQSQLERHIGYDIGAEGVTRHVAAALNAPAVMTRYSRLLIDPNRGRDDPTLVMRLSDGAVVPGNALVDRDEISSRIERFYEPYDAGIDAAIDEAMTAGKPPALFSIHSFTPIWRGVPRPWHVAILWDRDDRLARPMIDAFRADPELCVGDNEPYTGELTGDTMNRHGTGKGLAHALIEIRQDLIGDDAGITYWGDRVARVLKDLSSLPGLNDVLPVNQRNGADHQRF